MKNSGIKPKKKSASLKNQIRSLERIIAKNPNVSVCTFFIQVDRC